MLKRAGILGKPPAPGPFCNFARPRPPWPVGVVPAQPPNQRHVFMQPPHPIGSRPIIIDVKAKPPAYPPAPWDYQPVSKSASLAQWQAKAVESKPKPPATKEVEHPQGKISVAAKKVIKDSNENVAVGVAKRNKVPNKATEAVKDSSENIAMGVGKGDSTTKKPSLQTVSKRATCRAAVTTSNTVAEAPAPKKRSAQELLCSKAKSCAMRRNCKRLRKVE